MALELREFFAAFTVDDLDPLVKNAFERGINWLHSSALDDVLELEVPPVFGLADGNLANFLWDGSRIRLVDFENSGRSDRAYELADIVEHISFWADGSLDDEQFLGCFELTSVESRRLVELRRLFALLWLKFLLPGGPAHHRNPPGTLQRQAERMVARLGSAD